MADSRGVRMQTSNMIEFVSENARWLAASFLLLFASTFGQTLFIGLSGGEIRETYGLSNGAFGAWYMVVTLSSAAVLSVLGSVLDTRPLQAVLFWTILLLATGAAAVGFSNNLVVLICGLFLLRLFGQGMIIHASFTALGRWFNEKRGRATALSVMGFNAGEAILPLAFVAFASVLGWQAMWIAVAIFLVICVLPITLVLVRVERSPVGAKTADIICSRRHWTRRDALRDPCFYLLSLGLLAPVTIASAVFFHQSHLAKERGWEAHVFASSITVYAVVAVISVLLAGALIDRFESLKILPLHLLPLAVGCWVLASVEGPWSIFAFMALYAVAEPCSLALSGTIWPQIYGTRHLGAIRAVQAAALSVFSAVGPGLAGILIDLGIPLERQIRVMGWYCLLITPFLFRVAKLVAERETA